MGTAVGREICFSGKKDEGGARESSTYLPLSLDMYEAVIFFSKNERVLYYLVLYYQTLSDPIEPKHHHMYGHDEGGINHYLFKFVHIPRFGTNCERMPYLLYLLKLAQCTILHDPEWNRKRISSRCFVIWGLRKHWTRFWAYRRYPQEKHEHTMIFGRKVSL